MNARFNRSNLQLLCNQCNQKFTRVTSDFCTFKDYLSRIFESIAYLALFPECVLKTIHFSQYFAAFAALTLALFSVFTLTNSYVKHMHICRCSLLFMWCIAEITRWGFQKSTDIWRKTSVLSMYIHTRIHIRIYLHSNGLSMSKLSSIATIISMLVYILRLNKVALEMLLYL